MAVLNSDGKTPAWKRSSKHSMNKEVGMGSSEQFLEQIWVLHFEHVLLKQAEMH